MEIAFTGLFGAIFGSFLNVVAYRLPRHESVVTGRFALHQLRDSCEALRQCADSLLASAQRTLPQVL